MRKLAVMLVLVLFTIPAFSQSILRGVVKDASDSSVLPGANIVIEKSYKGVHTTSDGSFVINGISAGKYNLVVSFMGFQTQVVQVTVPQDRPVEILMQRSSILTQEVIVNATRADNRTPSTRSDVSRKYIRSVNLGQDIPIILSMTPSIITSSDAGAGIGYTSMRIRGSDQTRINVSINGVPINDPESHGVFWVNMPDIAASTDNIQIQRGVGTSTNGAAAFGATISLETDRLQEKAYAEMFSSAGSFNTFRNAISLGTGLLENGFALDGRISVITSDGFIDRASSDLSSFYLSLGHYGEKTTVKALAFGGREKTYQAWDGVPGNVLDTNRRFNPTGIYYDADGRMRYHDNEIDNYQQDHYQLHLTHQFDPRLVGNVSVHYTYGRGYFEQKRMRQRFSNYGLPNVEINGQTVSRLDLIRRRWLDNHFYGVTSSLNYNGTGRLNAILGLGLNRYDGGHFGEFAWTSLGTAIPKGLRYYDNIATKQDLNTFLKVNYELFNGFYVFGDVQYRNIKYDLEGLSMIRNSMVQLDQNADFNFINPKTGFLYDVNSSNKIYAFYGIGNREPVRRDFTESTPESRPKHETLRNVEIGYSFTRSDFQAGVNYYRMDYKNQLIPTGEINDVGGATRRNVDRSYRTGLEFEAAWKPAQIIELAGNLSLSRNKIQEFIEYSDVLNANWERISQIATTYLDTDIAYSPSVVGAGIISIFPVENLSVSLHTKLVSKQYIDNTMNSARMLDGYGVSDLKLAYLIPGKLFRELEVSIAVNNVYNAQYSSNAWIYKGYLDGSNLMTLSDGYFPQAGRHFLAGLRLRL
jgi:iron complex outermembrane recepter protein